RINLIRFQSPFLETRLGPPDVIENCCGEGPITPSRHFGVQGSERAFAADECRRLSASFLTFTMAHHALVGIKLRAKLCISIAWRKFFSVRANGDVHGLNFLRRGSSPNIFVARCLRRGRNS